MTPELIGILAVGATLGIGLGGLILILGGWLRNDIAALRTDVQSIDRRVSRIEGKLGITPAGVAGVGE